MEWCKRNAVFFEGKVFDFNMPTVNDIKALAWYWISGHAGSPDYRFNDIHEKLGYELMIITP
ncbi:hypothetical protein FRX31_032805 [Thalictrum thalictroides]|uniref:Uncharacterized protein n=1 Tax=Thalictrum thalictroides TaxID=46969 RepID=A0A7J6UY96_THATH|nr:hypothetical protein FRX31_032805 [Thalictrum thalictroides]